MKKYLLDYLNDKENLGNVIMISGEWGVGKTHFWKYSIIPEIEKNKENNIYISLYGKESLDSIQNEVLIKAYTINDNKNKITTKAFSLFSNVFKNSISGFDFSNLIGEIEKGFFKKISEQTSGDLIICFDDFERKSTNVDLNDLFGFITQLALEMKYLVVIILNEEFFKDKDAQVFNRIKEKTVNKYLKYHPTINELFKILINSNKKYQQLKQFYDIIKNTLEGINIVNARIYLSTFNNCLEYFKKYDEYTTNEQIGYLVVMSAYWLKYNRVVYFDRIVPVNIINFNNIVLKQIEIFINSNPKYKKLGDFITILKENLKRRTNIQIEIENAIEFINDNIVELFDLYRYNLYIRENLSLDTKSKDRIISFIETGII